MTLPTPQAVLFDLDGTLVDTAPDLAAAANRLLATRGCEALPVSVLRPLASQGARGLLGATLQLKPEDADFEVARDEFLAYYGEALCVYSALFDGMEAVLQRLEAKGIRWGIVTNKSVRFTTPLLEALGLADRCAVVVSGDTTSHSKPHPEPILYACKALDVLPTRCVYVGDDLRDVKAAHAAGMPCIVARYGYCGGDTPPETWGGEALIDEPAQLLLHLGLA